MQTLVQSVEIAVYAVYGVQEVVGISPAQCVQPVVTIHTSVSASASGTTIQGQPCNRTQMYMSMYMLFILGLLYDHQTWCLSQLPTSYTIVFRLKRLV